MAVPSPPLIDAFELPAFPEVCELVMIEKSLSYQFVFEESDHAASEPATDSFASVSSWGSKILSGRSRVVNEISLK